MFNRVAVLHVALVILDADVKGKTEVGTRELHEVTQHVADSALTTGNQRAQGVVQKQQMRSLLAAAGHVRALTHEPDVLGHRVALRHDRVGHIRRQRHRCQHL